MRNGQTSEQLAAKFSGNRDFRLFESTGVSILIEDPFQPPIHLLHQFFVHTERVLLVIRKGLPRLLQLADDQILDARSVCDSEVAHPTDSFGEFIMIGNVDFT
jgi:hypothetical protein